VGTPTPLELAVRENVTWCDLVCRSHRFTPEADDSVWWSARRTPSLYPDAVTISPAAMAFDVLGRIHDAPGASVKDSFVTLDLDLAGYTPLFDATWIARPPLGRPSTTASQLRPVTERYAFGVWARAWGGPDGVLLPGLLRTSGVTVLGAGAADTFDVGGILHHTRIRGVEVVGLSNLFGSIPELIGAAAARFPEAWLVGHEQGPALADALHEGFADVGPLRVWTRER